MTDFVPELDDQIQSKRSVTLSRRKTLADVSLSRSQSQMNRQSQITSELLVSQDGEIIRSPSQEDSQSFYSVEEIIGPKEKREMKKITKNSSSDTVELSALQKSSLPLYTADTQGDAN